MISNRTYTGLILIFVGFFTKNYTLDLFRKSYIPFNELSVPLIVAGIIILVYGLFEK